jgi:DNA-binding GntR family transcriptional regulator
MHSTSTAVNKLSPTSKTVAGAKSDKGDKGVGAMTRALKTLKAMIIDGELSPGVQIRQEEMAVQLEVSRVPLREAMNVLADQGLLFHRPHQGYFVTKRAAGEYAQIRRMLHLLENELMVTIRWPDAETLKELYAFNEQMRVCVTRADLKLMTELNRRFHFCIFSLSPNQLIVEEVRRLWSMIEPSMWTKYDRLEDRVKTLAEHDGLLAALKARDRTQCVAQLEVHRYSADFGLPIELPGVAPEPA